MLTPVPLKISEGVEDSEVGKFCFDGFQLGLVVIDGRSDSARACWVDGSPVCFKDAIGDGLSDEGNVGSTDVS